MTTRTITRVKSILQAGRLGKAAHAAFQPPPQPITSESFQTLAALHPEGPPAAALPGIPKLPGGREAPYDNVEPGRELRDFLKKQCRGRRGGFTGVKAEHILPLINDAACMQGLADIMTAIRNGTLGRRAKPFLLSSALLGIPKPQGGTRPLAAGEIYYRFAACWELDAVQKTAAPHLLTAGQYAIGIPGGVETGSLLVNTFLSGTADMGELLGGLSVDVSNAFNELPRELVLKRLFEREELASIWRITHWAYSEPSDLWVVSRGQIAGHLMSAQGVKQGDPLAMLLFALVVHHLYKDTLDSVNRGVSEKSKDFVRSVSIADDLNLLGRPERVIAAFDIFVDLATKVGLRINPDKSKFLWKHDATLPDKPQQALDARGIECVPALKVFGVPIGRPDLVSKMCCDVVHKHARFWSAVLHPRLPHQHAHLLLRFSGMPRMNFLMRTVAPSLLAPALKEFDDIILGSVLAKLNIPRDSLPTAALKQIILPVRRGGAGLRSMARTHPAAYLGSFSHASFFLANLRFGGKQVAPSDNSLTLAIAKCLRFIRRSAPRACLMILSPPCSHQQREEVLVPDSILLSDSLKHALSFSTSSSEPSPRLLRMPMQTALFRTPRPETEPGS